MYQSPKAAGHESFDVQAARRDTESFLNETVQIARDQGFTAHDLPLANGKSLLMLQKSAGKADGESFYMSSGVHGNEPSGIFATRVMLASGLFDDQANWTIFPLVSVENFRQGRYNSPNGTNPNRDYITETLPEVAGHAGWIKENARKIKLAMCLHED